MEKKVLTGIVFFLYIICSNIYEMELNVGEMETGYLVPLDEIAEKLECIHEYMCMPCGASWGYRELEQSEELGELPEQGILETDIYITEGNKLLFLPEGMGNTEIKLGNHVCEAYYSEKEKGYLFYHIRDWALSENGVPVNSPDNGSLTCCTVREDNTGEEKGYCLNELSWLGRVKVNYDTGEMDRVPSIKMKGNEYINAMLDGISDTLREKQKYGEYDIYINRFERIENGDETQGFVDFVVDGEGIKENGAFLIYDTGDIQRGFSLCGPAFEGTGYFTDSSGAEYEHGISQMIMWNRGMIHLEVTEEMEPYSNGNNGDAVVREQYGSTVDFGDMSPKELAELIGNLCSYCEWYGMKELGCRDGITGDLNGRKVALYLLEDEGNMLFFIPIDETNAIMQGKDNVECPVCVDGKGNMVFYQIKTNPYAHTGWLKTTFVMKKEISTNFMEYLQKLGEERVEIRAFPDLEMPAAGEDEYVRALKEYVEELLRQSGKQGQYDIYMGEYEAVFANKVCMSAAVIGEEEYYVRYLVVKYGEEDYYFWPIGFGLDGSLEECEAERHTMNKICIERVRQLNHKL